MSTLVSGSTSWSLSDGHPPGTGQGETAGMGRWVSACGVENANPVTALIPTRVSAALAPLLEVVEATRCCRANAFDNSRLATAKSIIATVNENQRYFRFMGKTSWYFRFTVPLRISRGQWP